MTIEGRALASALVLASPFLLASVLLIRHLRRRGTIPGEVQHLPPIRRRLLPCVPLLLVLVALGAAIACVTYPSPAVVLQREAAGYKATLRQARARVLTAADLVRLDLCDRNVRLTDDAAHEGYPTVTAEARAAASLMRQSCVGAEKWGSAQNPVDMGRVFGDGGADAGHQPPADLAQHSDGGVRCGSDC